MDEMTLTNATERRKGGTLQPDQRNKAMIDCIRLWTGSDGESRFEKGGISLDITAHGDLLSGKYSAKTVSFQMTASGGALDWHTAPVRQLVITLTGVLNFQTRAHQHFILKPGVVLLAEDTVGGGHSWKLVDDEPWRRIYVVLAPDARIPFTTAEIE
jgi:quercetin dioxygenase-like cupin family protein